MPPVHWMDNLAQLSFAPGRVRTSLSRLEQAWSNSGRAADDLEGSLRSFPLGSEALMWLLASSSISAEKLIHDPEALVWLSHPEICGVNRSVWQMKVDLARLRDASDTTAKASNFEHLRIFKGRELLRIALREVAQAAPLEQTALEVSCVADLCVQEVFNVWNASMRQEQGDPASNFCVLGMGKLGGKELNYSSDIDLVFVYSEEGQLTPNFSYHNFFNRLGENIIGTFSSSHPAGSLFRVDMRLRPEGDSGPLTRSLESMETYYAGYGETWERMAVAKARCIAGDEELGYEVVQRLQPFVYPRFVSPEMIEEVAHTKGRLERELAGHKNRHRDLKNGYGGIREIEFVVQSLQLLHGARHPFLQQPSTLKALEAMGTLNLQGGLAADKIETLQTAYRFLRTVEHRIQIEAERQTHTLPTDLEALSRIAASLHFDSPEAFEAKLRQVTQDVRQIFEHHFALERAEEDLDFSRFRDAARAQRLLEDMRSGGSSSTLSPRTRRVFRQFEPALVRAVSDAADPDGVLNLFSRFVKSYTMCGALYEVLMEYPRLLELFVGIFDASPVLSETVIKFPDLVESVARSSDLDEEMTVARYQERAEEALQRSQQDTRASAVFKHELDWLRAFRRFELFRILLRDVMGVTDLDGILREYTALAEACLIRTVRSLGLEDSITIIALGKFGARELSFGSDLDLVFVGKDAAAAQAIVREYGRISAAGGMDEIDPRLRPEGAAGPLVHSLDSYRHYYENRAQLWEAQALSKARPICGTEGEAFLSFAKAEWERFGQTPDLTGQVRAMLERVFEERSHGDRLANFKTGRGGLMALEFAVQAHQMRHALWAPNTLEAARLLEECGCWAREVTERVVENYRFLRRVAFVLRRYHNKSQGALPRNADELQGLSKRLGFTDVREFQVHYDEFRRTSDQLVTELLS